MTVMMYLSQEHGRRGKEFIKESQKVVAIALCQTLFVRFNTLQFALVTENFVKYFPTNN